MNSSDSQQPDRFRPTPSETRALPSKDVLEEVLRQTLVDADLAKEMEELDLLSLIEVARRHRGTIRPTAPILRELVASLLTSRFPGLEESPGFRDTVAKEIASTLMDDPYQRELMQRFWSKLCDRAA